MAKQTKHSRSGPNTRFEVRCWLPWLAIGFVWLWFCGPMMCGQTVVGFRDSASLYFPMFEAIDAAWAEGKVPLWNPFCNFGMPLVADGTSSVFYPGKAIFVARFLSYPSRYGIYLGLHVLLAAVSTYWLARKMRCQRPGATIAAIAFVRSTRCVPGDECDLSSFSQLATDCDLGCLVFFEHTSHRVGTASRDCLRDDDFGR